MITCNSHLISTHRCIIRKLRERKCSLSVLPVLTLPT
jgi:hypothetical protein